MRREQVRRLVIANHYFELVLNACKEFQKTGESKTFPWVENLSQDDKLQFHMELLTVAQKSADTGDWAKFDYLIQDWKATAEVEGKPELAGELMIKGNPEEYVKLKD